MVGLLSTRRRFLAGLPAVASSPWLLGAAGPSDLRIGQLQLGDEWNPRPTGLRRLLWEVTQRTSIEVHLDPAEVKPDDKALFDFPLLYWGGSGAIPPVSEAAIRRLRRHLTYGGMLLIDSADADPGGPFDRGVRRVVNRILPRSPLKRIDEQHVMYKSFYLVSTQSGRNLRLPYMEGASIDDRYAVVYGQNDLAGAWARDAFGRWEYEVTPGGQRQREMTFRLGINIIMYALCLDYKDDLVHAPFIMKRRR